MYGGIERKSSTTTSSTDNIEFETSRFGNCALRAATLFWSFASWIVQDFRWAKPSRKKQEHSRLAKVETGDICHIHGPRTAKRFFESQKQLYSVFIIACARVLRLFHSNDSIQSFGWFEYPQKNNNQHATRDPTQKKTRALFKKNSSSQYPQLKSTEKQKHFSRCEKSFSHALGN